MLSHDKLIVYMVEINYRQFDAYLPTYDNIFLHISNPFLS